MASAVAEAQRIGGHHGKADEGYHKGNHQVDVVGYPQPPMGVIISSDEALLV